MKQRDRMSRVGKKGDTGRSLLCFLVLGGAAVSGQEAGPGRREVSSLPARRAGISSRRGRVHPQLRDRFPGTGAAPMGTGGPASPFLVPVSLRRRNSVRARQTTDHRRQRDLAGIPARFGRHWNLDYTPTLRYYSNSQFHDGFDNSVRLIGGAVYEDWVLGLSQTYASSSTPLVETGEQTDTESYVTALTANYRFNSKFSVDLSMDQNFLSAAGFESSKTWSTMDWLNYQFWPRLDASIGAGGGYIAVNTGSDMTFEDVQGRVSWRATDKLSLQVHAGVDIREFMTGGESDLVSPIFGATLSYQAFEHTSLSLLADRYVNPSVFQNLITETTTITLSFSQRLLKQLDLTLRGTYYNVAYTAAAASAIANRTDNNYGFNARLSTPFLKRGTFSLTYQLNDNSSTAPGYTFSSNQVGGGAGPYRF